MYRIAVVDDDYKVISEMTNIIATFFRKDYTQDDFTDGYELINALDKEHYDIVFLDIEMKYVGGLKTIEAIRRHDPNETVHIVFISSHEDNLIPFFQYHPYAFLRKPISYEETSNVLCNIVRNMQHSQRFIKLMVNRNEIHICIADIVYIQSVGHSLLIKMKNGEELRSYSKIDAIYKILIATGDSFLRIHASYVINGHYVDYYKKDTVKINGQILPISRKYQKELVLRFHEVL